MRIHQECRFPVFRSDYERFAVDKVAGVVLATGDDASLESVALKIASFYAPTLATPQFTLSAEVPIHAITKGNPLTIKITAQDEGKAAPDSLVEMEIWDASGNSVYKQHQEDENFSTGQ